MLHKVWDGLIDSYLYTGNEKAKSVVVKLSNWAYKNFINMPDAKFQQMLACEFGGMNESLAEVYAITGDKKYLDLSYKFYHKKIYRVYHILIQLCIHTDVKIFYLLAMVQSFYYFHYNYKYFFN